MKKSGTNYYTNKFIVGERQDGSDVIAEVTFKYYFYYWSGDYMQPPEHELIILEVEMDGDDITNEWTEWFEEDEILEKITNDDELW